MKTQAALLFAIALSSGCTIPTTAQLEDPQKYLENPPRFVSIDPKSSAWIEKDSSSGVKKLYWEDLNNEEVNKYLPIERSFVSIQKVEGDTSIGFASAKYTGSAGTYKVVIDYAKYRDETMSSSNNLACRVGVGVRVLATVFTTKSNIDLGNLFAISAAAKAGYLSGRIEVLKIGIDSSRLSLVLPPPTDINDTSLQNAMQAVAAIRAKLYDTDTRLTPHILAVEYSKVRNTPAAQIVD
ncbi:hypothetical protein Pres01_55370 [Metapseudomonas resinovorans]|uniref:hypothetical protein n=1 Tax=Metapseudomonas resinovorans TaxID=53412 RepID=UPI0009866E9B|nr:hypothetical protein [Pseudomonas resinovorans]GLZ89486.1 hypothetical protein Pres01_55370 [Pseudomonas resinovorans]